MAPFDDARVRIDRAKTNLDRLNGEITNFGTAHPNAYRAVVEHDIKGNLTVIARVGERPPQEWGLVVGDILVDMRTALDYAVYALAVNKCAPSPPPHPRRIEFPIWDNPVGFADRGRRAIASLSDPARAYIEQVQPYQPGYGGPDCLTSPLWMLDQLGGINKHRFIHVLWTRLVSSKLVVNGDGVDVADLRVFKIDGELVDGTVLATGRLVAKAMKAKIQIGAQMTVNVAIEPPAGLPLTDVSGMLGKLGGPVEDVLNHLEAFL